VPLLIQNEWPSARLVRAHFALAMLGLAFYVGSLSVGGILQGLALNDPQVPFAGALNRPLVCFRVGTLGDLLMAAGNVCLALNLAWLLARCCRACCVPAIMSAVKPQMAEAAR